MLPFELALLVNCAHCQLITFPVQQYSMVAEAGEDLSIFRYF